MIRLIYLFAFLALGTSVTAALQAPGDTVPKIMTLEEPVPRDQAPFGNGTVLKTVFEKTFLGVNVLRLELHVDQATTAALQKLPAGPGHADGVAAGIIEAPEAWVRMEFLRSVSQSKYFGGIRQNLAKAREAGLITRDHEQRINTQLPKWYDFLAKRGVKKGDVLVYWIRGTVMKTTYYAADLTILFNYTQEDPEARHGVLGSYLAPGSDFREGLIKSLPK
jgi:hypothetical protein